MIKKNIAVFMGGWSSERDISMRSGISVYNNLDSSKYNKCIFHILAVCMLFTYGMQIAPATKKKPVIKMVTGFYHF